MYYVVSSIGIIIIIIIVIEKKMIIIASSINETMKIFVWEIKIAVIYADRVNNKKKVAVIEIDYFCYVCAHKLNEIGLFSYFCCQKWKLRYKASFYIIFDRYQTSYYWSKLPKIAIVGEDFIFTEMQNK